MTMKNVKNVETFEVCFMHSELKCIIDDGHILKSSYDDSINFFIVSSYEFLTICQASIADET